MKPAPLAVPAEPRASADAKDLGLSILGELSARFEADGGFPEIGNFMTGWDRHFGFKDWLTVFRTVPSLRKYLLPALAWNVLFSRRDIQGFAERIIPGRRYNFEYRSFCTDLLILETLGRAYRLYGLPVPEGLKRAAADCIALTFDNCYTVVHDGRSLPMLSYYPRKDHRVAKDNPVYKLFFSRDDNVPDNDTSCIILGSMLAVIETFGLDPALYRHRREDTATFLDSMEQHIYREGKYGWGSLSYENGVLPEDRGVLTWVFDEHNELDPTSNIDILHYLALVDRIFGRDVFPRLPELTNKILAFLGNHVRKGDFLSQRFQTYYPLGSTYILWWRFKEHFDALPPPVRSELDRDGEADRIDAYLRDRGQEIFKEGGTEYNPYDFLLVAPFLYSHGLMRKRIGDWILSEDCRRHFRENHYEFFHLRYPSKIIGAPVLLPDALILEICQLMARSPD